MGKELTRRAALACLGSGVAVTLVGSSAFGNVSAERGVSVETDADPSALLGLIDQSGSASLSGADDSTVVFEVSDNIGGLTAGDLSVAIERLESGGSTISNPGLSASVDGNYGGANQFGVELRCDGANSIDGNYYVVLSFEATSAEVSVSAERTTNSLVSISCTHDYSDESNYRDEDGGGAAQPENPKGSINNPSGVGQEGDGNSATAISTSGGEPAKVGWRLPTIPASGSYELEVEVESNGNTLTGDWITYLVDRDGTKLTATKSLSKGENVFTFTASENSAIKNHRSDLYLIFETTSNGNKNQVKIDFFEVRPT